MTDDWAMGAPILPSDYPTMYAPVPDWRDSLDLSAHRAQVELKRMAEFARRSLGQRIRYARADIRRMRNESDEEAKD